jgi:Fe-S-cluster containining protein
MLEHRSDITSNSKNLCFEGCDGCGARCCSSNLIFLTLYDIQRVSQYFPIFFRMKDGKLSMIFFFYNKIGKNEEDKKCIYLKNDLCSIYNHRPYACQSFPFSFDSQKNVFQYSNECHGIRKENKIETRNITKFIDNTNNINKSIIENFVTPNYIHHAKNVYKDTDDFLKFCMENNVLINFRTMYKDSKYDKFQTNLQEELYVVNKLKFAFLKLKKPELLENGFLSYLNAQVFSVGHIDRMI